MQVVDHFARTMFTLTSEASQLSATKDQAEDTLKKVCVCVYVCVCVCVCVCECV